MILEGDEGPTEGVDRCLLCRRPRQEGALCEYHALAYTKLQEGYEGWKRAYGEMDYQEYLRRLAEHEAAGVWVKEVARLLLKRGGVLELS